MFKIKYNSKENQYIGSIEENYFKICQEKRPKILDEINNKPILDINDWISIFDKLKAVVTGYQNKELLGGEKKKREKILQQKLVYEFNTKQDANYFAYDMEYNLEGANDYVLDANKNPIVEKETKTPGRSDIMLINKPINNKITIYFMEVKEGIGSFSGVSQKNQSFGSGIVGHIKNYMPLLSLAKNNKHYKSMYRADKNHDNSTIDIRKTLLCEVKNIMSFYQEFDLIENNNFKNIDYDSLELNSKEEGIELVFFLGNYKSGEKVGSFENHLGIRGGNAKYSVKKLLDNNMRNELNLDYVSQDEMFDFRFLKTEKNCDDEDFNLEIDTYGVIKKDEFK
ncbi:MAG: hypothetical protein HFE81_02040 [Bacilli bacterium]|nr:hypothetical protein [Bacilli bacterium]